MTELSFLIELLLNHDLPKATKDLLASRIKEVEEKLSNTMQPARPPIAAPISQNQFSQAPSTLAAMARHAQAGLIPPIEVMPAPEMPPIPEPVAVIAQTPQAAAAINSRNSAIAASISGKVDKTTGRPKKW